MSILLDGAATPTSATGGTPVRHGLPVLPRSRRPLVAVASAALVCASIAAFAAIYSSAGHKTAVIAVVRPIAQGQAITGEDLAPVEVSVPSGVEAIPVSDAAQLAGKRAAVAIPPGSLLVPGDLTGAPAVAAGDAVVGLALKEGQYPASGVSPGDSVMVVQTASPGTPLTAPTSAGPGATQSASAADGGATGVLVPAATVFDTGPPSAGGSASLVVSVEIPATLASAVAGAAAAGQVSVVLLPDDGAGVSAALPAPGGS